MSEPAQRSRPSDLGMPKLNATVRRDIDADVTTVTWAGTLNFTTAATARSTLLKCIAECPSAVVVDLREVIVEEPLALTVFPTAAARRGHGPDCAILVCAGRDARDDLGRVSIGLLPGFADPAQALAAAADARMLVLRSELTIRPTLDAAAVARRAVKSACVDWDILHVAEATRLIVSELVTNVVRHAGTEARLELSLRGDFLHVRVRDSSTAQPVPRQTLPGATQIVGHDSHGRGLHLVEVYSSGWGYVVSGPGKVVWATVRIRPVGTS
jgi:anti-sigma regulatory factor (Ser/Thr protein kinase)